MKTEAQVQKRMPVELKALSNYLHFNAHGMHRAKSQIEIASALGVNTRTFRARVATLITDYLTPICTTANDGYYLPRTREESRPGVASLKSREDAIRERREALETALDAHFGQPRLFDVGTM